MSAPEVVIWCDGSCPIPNGPGGHAAILLRVGFGGEVIAQREIVGFAVETTNNRMELMAVCAGLEALTRPCRVKVHIDSQYVMHAFTQGWLERWKRNGWRKGGGGAPRNARQPTLMEDAQAETVDSKAIKNRDLWERLDNAAAPHTIEWEFVKGHSGVELNERADRLAGEQTKIALDRAMFEGPRLSSRRALV